VHLLNKLIIRKGAQIQIVFVVVVVIVIGHLPNPHQTQAAR
jgi:hypothetical protein